MTHTAAEVGAGGLRCVAHALDMRSTQLKGPFLQSSVFPGPRPGTEGSCVEVLQRSLL